MVMKILRDNKESLFGVLETFAQDPIISWRLTNEKKPDPPAIDPKKNINDEIIGSIMQHLSLEINPQQDAPIDQSPRRAHESEEKMQQINEKAVNALLRVKQKLRGNDFQEGKQLTVEEQVSKLIKEATSAVNICQSWPGWCPFW
jgi:serine/threonine-protein kinase mTOR